MKSNHSSIRIAWILSFLILGGCIPGLSRFPLDFSLYNLLNHLFSTPSIGGEVTDLRGSGLRLNMATTLNGTLENDPLEISRSGRFSFRRIPQLGSTYTITILQQPSNPSQICEVAGGTGTYQRNPITNILIQCSESQNLPMPVFSPPPGEFHMAQVVSISTTTPSSRIFYTTNSSNPACNPDGTGVGTEYTTTIPIPQPSLMGVDIRAIVCIAGRSSNVQSGLYRVTNGLLGMVSSSLATTPPAPTYTTSPQSTTLSPPPLPPPGTTIHYTVDGSLPTCSSPSTPNPVLMIVSTTIRAIACAPDWSASSVAIFIYNITGTVMTPTFTVAGGIYNNTQMVGLSVATPGASIRYALTTDGSTPVATCSSTLYSGPILVDTTNTRIRAIGCLTAWTDSPTTPIELYNLVVSLPTISPPSQAVQTSQLVSASSATSSASFHYTTDGSIPTCGSSTIPPIITGDGSEATVPVQVIACRTGFGSSGISSENYIRTGNLAPPTFSPIPGTYSTAQTVSLIQGAGNPGGTEIRFRTDGIPATCTDTLYSAAVGVAVSQTITAISCRTTPLWNPSSSTSGSYTITGTLGSPIFTPAPGTYNDVQSVTIHSNPGSTIFYNLAIGSIPSVPTCGSGSTAQPIAITNTDTRILAIACQAGWTDSAIGSATYILQASTPIPNFPAFTIFGNTATVSFTTTTPIADLRVVQGSFFSPPPDPTCAGPVASSVTIPAYPTPPERMIKAIACRTNFLPSFVFSGRYDVYGPVATPMIFPSLDGANRVTVTPNSPPVPTFQEICYRIGADPECAITLGGSPNPLGGTCATGSIPYVPSARPVITTTSNFRARACSANHEQSLVASQTFSISGTVGAVGASPSPGTFFNDPTITLNSVGSTAIYYRNDGINPDCTGVSANLYSGPFLQTPITLGGAEIRAIGCASGMTPSAVATLNYIYQVDTPSTTSVSGTYTDDVSVILTNVTTGATMRFLLNGITPANCSSGALFGSAISLPSDALNPIVGLRSIGCRTNYLTSPAMIRNYSFVTAPIIPSLASTGENILSPSYTTNSVDIRLQTSTINSLICARTDGSPAGCDGTTGTCAPGSSSLGLSPQNFPYNAVANITLSASACKLHFNPGSVMTRDLVDDQNNFRLFVTQNSYTGALGGISGADNICNTDPARPYSLGSYRALIVQTGVRQTPASGAMDWVLYPSTNYIRPGLAHLPIFMTDAVSNPPNTFLNQIAPLPNSVWTGIQSGGLGVGPLTTGAAFCSGWTSAIATGRYGNLSHSDVQALDVFTTTGFCGVSNRLICAENRKRIYVTTNNYTGALGGKAGADSICDVTDPGRPSGGTFKAMLRFVDRTPAHTDWVFHPNTRYFRPDGTYIAQTTPSRILPPILTNAIVPLSIRVRTGFANDFTISATNCSEFTVSDASIVNSGWGDNTDTNIMLAAFGDACNNSTLYRIVCVEQ